MPSILHRCAQSYSIASTVAAVPLHPNHSSVHLPPSLCSSGPSWSCSRSWQSAAPCSAKHTVSPVCHDSTRFKLRFNAHFETLKKVEGEVRLESAKFFFCFISEVFLAPSEGPSSLQIFVGTLSKSCQFSDGAAAAARWKGWATSCSTARPLAPHGINYKDQN